MRVAASREYKILACPFFSHITVSYLSFRTALQSTTTDVAHHVGLSTTELTSDASPLALPFSTRLRLYLSSLCKDLYRRLLKVVLWLVIIRVSSFIIWPNRLLRHKRLAI